MDKLGVGLYGTRGHQIHGRLAGHPNARLVAVAAFDKPLPTGCDDARVHDSLDALLADPEVDLVSLCSPQRAEQAAHAVRALRAGRHVYAEKPCALNEPDLDAIMAAARETGRQFHEMAGASFERPYAAMRAAAAEGAIGEIVQVLAQKCYPWADWRPADENADGGLSLQAGIYLTRFVEHVAGVKIADITLHETALGNPVLGHGCRMAASVLMTLANGGTACGVANYLNPIGKRVWGYEILRLFGTGGILESSFETGTVRLLRRGGEPEYLDPAAHGKDYFDRLVLSLLGRGDMPMSMEDELSPTRWIVRARQAFLRKQAADSDQAPAIAK